MKSISILFILLTTSIASAASFNLPEGYEGMLDCPANRKLPALMVASNGQDLFLAAKVSNSVALFQLEIIDADMGYVGYEADNLPASLKNLMDSVYIYNDEEEVEDPADSVITGGSINLDGKGTVQKCEVLGVFKTY
jgi:hypothetical protein